MFMFCFERTAEKSETDCRVVDPAKLCGKGKLLVSFLNHRTDVESFDTFATLGMEREKAFWNQLRSYKTRW